MAARVEDLLKKQDCIRVFGYGSLIWKPDFEYDRMLIGYIEGYERRFWQGNTHHRGTVDKPGRVLTLTKQDKGRCYGVVYEVTGAEKIEIALDYLEQRERHLGGYDIVIIPVVIQNTDTVIQNNVDTATSSDSVVSKATDDTNRSHQSLVSILYYATPENHLYKGPGCLHDLAEIIATSQGVCGYNAEYLLRITDFMREEAPEVEEKHLYKLDALVRTRLGLGHNNVLPWTSLVTMEMFHKSLKRMCSDGSESDQSADELSSSRRRIAAGAV